MKTVLLCVPGSWAPHSGFLHIWEPLAEASSPVLLLAPFFIWLAFSLPNVAHHAVSVTSPSSLSLLDQMSFLVSILKHSCADFRHVNGHTVYEGCFGHLPT